MDPHDFFPFSDRASMAGELHARPYPELHSDGEAICLALKAFDDGKVTAPEWIAHLVWLLIHASIEERPAPDANQFEGQYWSSQGEMGTSHRVCDLYVFLGAPDGAALFESAGCLAQKLGKRSARAASDRDLSADRNRSGRR